MNHSMKSNFILRSIKLICLMVNVFFFMAYFTITCYPLLPWEIFSHIYIIFTAIYTILLFWLIRIYNGFMVGGARVFELAYSLSLASVIGSCITYIVMSGYMHKIFNPLGLIPLFAASLCWNILWSLFANKLYYIMYKAKSTAIIYRHDSDLRKLSQIKNFSDNFNVIRYIENPKDIHLLIEELDGCEAVFVAGVNATLRNGIAKYCIEKGILAYIEPKIGDVIMAGARHMPMFSIPIMQIHRASPKPEYLFFKRLIDILASLTAIVVLSPIMLLVAIFIKAYDRGPVLYRQVRLTRGRKEFKILKFRSMKVDAEKDGIARLASDNDDRITPVGRVIRACRLDELPQLFNILKGDMTIVGPRPERPEIAEQYERRMSAFSLRLQVKAGLTGYAQIYGRYNTEPYDKLQMDLMYINNMSFVQDLWLMLATVKILFMRESTSGVEEGQITAEVQKARNN